MDTFLVNNYATSSAGTASSSSSTSSAGKTKVDTTTFLKLLAKELSCQDPLNPTQDSDFITQMAQMTSLENSEDLYSNSTKGLDSMDTLISLSYMQFGASLAGKTVEVSTTDSSGNAQTIKGVVSKVNLSTNDNVFMLTIDGKDYPITSVAQVLTT